jgi:hypothetical protein
MTLPVSFSARRSHNTRNGHFYSLRVVYPNSRLPGDRSSEFGRIRQESRGWNAFSSDEDFDRALKAACHRAGLHSDIKVLLAEIRKTYMNWEHEEEMKTERAYETWVASLGDASGAGQDWDVNHAA